MFQSLLQYLFGSRAEPQILRLTPEQEKTHLLLRGDLSRMPAEDLTLVCEEYWRRFPTPGEEENQFREPLIIQTPRYYGAATELRNRDPEVVIPWACRCLGYSNYDAREMAADILQTVAKEQRLGGLQGTVEAALMQSIRRIPTYDNKEAQANTAALMTLATIGGKAAYQAIRYVLTAEEWKDDELRWSAAQTLQKLTGEPFLASPDPEEAALGWLINHPETLGGG